MHTGRHRGFAFVEMASQDEAEAVIASLNGRTVEGGTLMIGMAREREPGGGGTGRTEYGGVAGEARDYGTCDFELGGGPKKAEPRPAIRGNIARIWFYMSETYNVPLSTEKRQMLEEWVEADPVGEWERIRDTRIEQVQGNRNPHVRP